MALDASILEAAIKSSLTSSLRSGLEPFLPSTLAAEEQAEARRQRDEILGVLSEAIASAVAHQVVEHLKSNASVSLPALTVRSAAGGMATGLTDRTSAPLE